MGSGRGLHKSKNMKAPQHLKCTSSTPHPNYHLTPQHLNAYIYRREEVRCLESDDDRQGLKASKTPLREGIFFDHHLPAVGRTLIESPSNPAGAFPITPV